MTPGFSATTSPSTMRPRWAWRRRRHCSSLLPLYDPVRLIEEVAMLDQLSGGRLELGVGRGVSPYELRNFGVDPENSRAMFDEALAVLLAGLTRERLSFAGAH